MKFEVAMPPEPRYVLWHFGTSYSPIYASMHDFANHRYDPQDLNVQFLMASYYHLHIATRKIGIYRTLTTNSLYVPCAILFSLRKAKHIHKAP
jgi:hypothetical protein